MKITIECEECDAVRISNMIKSVLDVKKVSKFYPNAINSETDREGRVFINLNGYKRQDFVDLLSSDMLNLLSAANIDIDSPEGQSEILKIRQFYEAGKRGLELEKLLSLYIAWRDSLFKF